MSILKNFYKTIQIVLQVTVLVLIFSAFLVGLTKELFAGNEAVIRAFETSQSEVSYSLRGLIKFSKDFVALSKRNTEFNSNYPISPEMVSAAKTLRIISLAIFIFEAAYLVLMTFSFRYYSTFTTILISLVLSIVLKGFAIRKFGDIGLITSSIKYYNTMIVLMIVALCISLMSILLNIFIKPKSK